MAEDRLKVVQELLRDMAVDFDTAVTGLDAYLETDNPFTPDEAERYEAEFGRLETALRDANSQLQSFGSWLASRHSR